MYEYQQYLIYQKNDKNNQCGKLYCDGTMQKYLENKWKNESNEIKTIVMTNLKNL